MNDLLTQLRSTFASAFTTTFALYFKGKVKTPALADLPLLTVFGISTEQKHSGTLRDEATFTIGVQIFVNIRTYFDNIAGQGAQLDTMDALMELVEGRTSGDADNATIFGILADNLTIGGQTLYTDGYKVDYDEYQADGSATVGYALVTFTAHSRPNRQN